MRNKRRMIKNFILDHSKLSIILIYNIVTIAVLYLFYPIIPVLLGYFPNFLDISVKVGASFNLQYLSIALATVVFSNIVLLIIFRDIGKWKESIEKKDFKKIDKIRTKCINIPHVIFIIQILFVSFVVIIAGALVMTFTKAPMIVFLKIFTVAFSLFAVVGVLSYIFSKRVFTEILLRTYSGQGLQGIRINLSKKIFLQILPLLVVAILFTSMLGLSRLMEEKGNLVYEICKIQMATEFKDKTEFKNIDELYTTLKNIKVSDAKIGYFTVLKKDGSMTTSDGFKPGVYFKYFAKNPAQGDRIYGDASDVQGVVKSVKVSGQPYFAGVRFENTSDRTIAFFLVALASMLALGIVVLYFFSRTLSNEISLIAESLDEIAEGESVDLDKKLVVISNDEIGDLIIAFNKIQKREKDHMLEVEENQSILVEQERLASLGQLVGGIAHNLRTPIMSIAGAIEGLKDLVKEYVSSIGDKSVSDTDHREIARDMVEWLDKMGPYCSYMSDIITVVKDQTVQHTSLVDPEFTVDELISKVDILMNSELKRNCSTMKIDCKVDRNTKIKGDVSGLIQVLNNLITNAIQSYAEIGCEIDFIIQKNENLIEFIIKDYGAGISKEVKDKLFKEMITTKGKQGTGLGLFISYANIKGRFKGNMWFDSEEGKGTTFYVSLPINIDNIKDDEPN